MYNFIYAFMIVIMYFLAGISKLQNFKNTVSGFKGVFFLKNLPNIFYQIIILGVVILEIFAPVFILYSIQTNKHKYIAYISSISLAFFTVLATLLYHFPPIGGQYYSFMKNLTATGSLFLLSNLF